MLIIKKFEHFLLLPVIAFSLFAGAQKLSEQAPADKPIPLDAERLKKMEQAIAPYVKQARATLPQAKKKFLKGLPENEPLFVTIRLYDSDKKYEQVFIWVKSWKERDISGILSSDLSILKEHKRGDTVACKEPDVLDWTISKPDGSEEGNFVGKFLDTYKP